MPLLRWRGLSRRPPNTALLLSNAGDFGSGGLAGRSLAAIFVKRSQQNAISLACNTLKRATIETAFLPAIDRHGYMGSR